MTLHEASLLRKEIAIAPNVRVILVDSITQVRDEDAGAIVVAASHGGRSSAEFAMTLPLAAIFFNDAGVGKDNAASQRSKHCRKRRSLPPPWPIRAQGSVMPSTCGNTGCCRT